MSYLEGYGVGEARREKYLRYAFAAVVLAVVVGTLGYFWLRDYPERRQVATFLENMRKADFRAAYAQWGCTETTPCRDYPFERFVQDWGPKGPQGNAAAAVVSGGQHCESGRIAIVRYPGNHEVQLWVERKTGFIGFAPWPLETELDGMKARLRFLMRDLVGDCAPPRMKVP